MLTSIILYKAPVPSFQSFQREGFHLQHIILFIPIGLTVHQLKLFCHPYKLLHIGAAVAGVVMEGTCEVGNVGNSFEDGEVVKIHGLTGF